MARTILEGPEEAYKAPPPNKTMKGYDDMSNRIQELQSRIQELKDVIELERGEDTLGAKLDELDNTEAKLESLLAR